MRSGIPCSAPRIALGPRVVVFNQSYARLKFPAATPCSFGLTVCAAGVVTTNPVVHASSSADSEGSTYSMPTVLAIAGSDSGGGAGIQADLKSIAACGAFGTTAITALTAQNTRGVSGIEVTPAEFVTKQIDAVLEDIAIDVVKTGMLPNAQVVKKVAEALEGRPDLRLVVDPVLVTTSGDSLAAEEVANSIVKMLFPKATVVTPNLSEASTLLGGRPVDCLQAMEAAAKDLHALGPKYVLVKGGHLEANVQLCDVLFDGESTTVMPGPRIMTSNTHGTGCTTASAIAAFLARGLTPPAAIRAARHYITETLRHSANLQIGKGSQKPFNHLFGVNNWQQENGDTRLDLRLYAVTDPGCNERCRRTNAAAVEAALEGGATIIQLREKHADGAAFCREAEAVLAVTRRKGVKLLINDRIDIALAVGADGVHLGQDDIPAARARALLGAGTIIGVSVKTVEQARKAEADGADYLGAGAVYKTATKSSSTISMETLVDICRAVSIPVVAIGGITSENAQPCIAAGCAGVAVVSAIFGADDPASAARQILDRC